jgi:transposase
MTEDARVIRPDRSQLQWDIIDLEGLLPADHRARIVWRFVDNLDLSVLYTAIKSREGAAGRPAADPRVLLALWLYATVDGVGSARELARLAERELSYRWLAGGVPLNYHGLADFRVEHVAELDRLLTDSVVALIAEGLVSLKEIAIDGTKVRANASKASFKSGAKLAAVEAAVKGRLATLRSELDGDPAASSRRKQAAAKRAAEEVEARSQRALKALEQIRAVKEKRKKTHSTDEAKKPGEAKASLTDPDARNMKFSDGAIRPAYNAQIAATPEGVIVSINMTNRRNDSGLAVPMVEDIEGRYGQAPGTLLVDTHYATSDDIVALAERETGAVTVYAPLPHQNEDVKPETKRRRDQARKREPQPVKDWRCRMADPASQEIYRRRKKIEWVNAQRKNHGFGFIGVRGMAKAKAVALWHALAHNLMTAYRLRGAAIA